MPLPKPADGPTLNLFSLAGKTVLVTGGSRGIGLAACHAYAEAGAAVAFTYATSKDAEETAAKLASDTGARVQAYQADVRDRDAVARLIETVRADFGGRLDVVVVNAGVGQDKDALDLTPDEYRRVMDTNVDGAFLDRAGRGPGVQGAGERELDPDGERQRDDGECAAAPGAVQCEQGGGAASGAEPGGRVDGLRAGECGEPRVYLDRQYVGPAPLSKRRNKGGEERNESVGQRQAADRRAVIKDVPQEKKKQWMAQVPAERFCDPNELKGVSSSDGVDARRPRGRRSDRNCGR